MARRFLAVLLAAAALAACRHDSPDREPVATGPAPSMADAAPPRFGQDPAPTVPGRTLPTPRRTEQQPPRPPADIPHVEPGKDTLASGYDAARTQATAPRPQIGASPQALMSVPLSQLVGIHLSRSPLKVRSDDNVEYVISAQAGRLGEDKAYVLLFRSGMRSPAFVDLAAIKLSNPVFSLFGGGSVDRLEAEGRAFGVVMHADTSDGRCAATHPSQVELWAAAHHDAAHSARFSVSELFAKTATAGVSLKGAKGQATLVAYQDIPYSSGKISLAVFEPGGRMTPLPSELLARPDGKVVSVALHEAPAQRFGLRVSGSGGSRAIDVFDLSAAGQKPAAVDLNALVQQKPCGS